VTFSFSSYATFSFSSYATFSFSSYVTFSFSSYATFSFSSYVTFSFSSYATFGFGSYLKFTVLFCLICYKFWEQQISALCNWAPQNYIYKSFPQSCCYGWRCSAATFYNWTLRFSCALEKEEKWNMVCVMLCSLLLIIASASPDSMETLIPFDSLHYHPSFTRRSFVQKRNSKSVPYFPRIWIPLHWIAAICIGGGGLSRNVGHLMFRVLFQRACDDCTKAN